MELSHHPIIYELWHIILKQWGRVKRNNEIKYLSGDEKYFDLNCKMWSLDVP